MVFIFIATYIRVIDWLSSPLLRLNPLNEAIPKYERKHRDTRLNLFRIVSHPQTNDSQTKISISASPLLVRGDLAGDEQSVSLDTGASHRFPNVHLVLVNRCSVCPHN